MSFTNLTHIPMEITEKSLKNILAEQREETKRYVYFLIKDSHEKFMKIVGHYFSREQIMRFERRLEGVKVKLGMEK